MTKISVLTPSYNASKYIEKAIQSVLVQNYANFEHIIFDGGSQDGTIEILQKYPHLIWVSEKDKGQSDAMNKAFEKSTGNIIVYLNADDYFEPNAFNIIIEAFKNNADIDMVVGNLKWDLGTHQEIITPEIEYLKILYHFKYHFPYNPVSYFYTRDLQNKVGKFSLQENYAMDYVFLLRAFQLCKPLKINATLGCFVMTGENNTGKVNPLLRCKKVAIRHCYKHDKLQLPIYIFRYYWHLYLMKPFFSTLRNWNITK